MSQVNENSALGHCVYKYICLSETTSGNKGTHPTAQSQGGRRRGNQDASERATRGPKTEVHHKIAK